MRRALIALGLMGGLATWFAVGGAPTVAHAAPATKLLVHCCPDGVVGEPITANIQPVDDSGKDDGSFTGTVTFSTDFTENFTITPHDPGAGNRHKYTFKPGDVTDGGTAGKDFRVVFHEPGTGQFDATAPGLETVHDNPDGSHSLRNNDFTIEPAQATTTTTTSTTTTSTSTTTTAPSTTTTTGGGGGGGITTTTAPTAGTTTTLRPPSSTTTTTRLAAVTTTTSRRLPVAGSPLDMQTKTGAALLVFGALLIFVAADRAWRGRLLLSAGPANDEVVYDWIVRAFQRLVGVGPDVEEPDDGVGRRQP